mmetsp:Transcript_22040/g.24505  ORF Transcript_22040/g.24505 Transcript_22040/m.24505 type:complete len:130 (-) Transcript_22040:46-435(-)
MSAANREPGEYKLKHKGSGHEFNYKKAENKESNDYEDRVMMEGITTIIFMSLFVSFAFACCCAVCCSSCILGGLYKFHYTARELDIIQGIPQVSQVNMQQMPPHHQQVQPLANNIVRGQVVNMPQIQQP